MRKVVLVMHTSLDGFVGGPNGEMDWIKVDEEMFDFGSERTKEADTALYGRITFQMMDSYWPAAANQPGATKHDIEHSAWYNTVTKIVISRTLKGQNITNTKIVSDNLSNELTKLKQAQGKDILIYGSPTAVHSLLELNLIDAFWLYVNPILLGHGIPLLKGVKETTQLKLASSRVFSSGVVCLHYERT